MSAAWSFELRVFKAEKARTKSTAFRRASFRFHEKDPDNPVDWFVTQTSRLSHIPTLTADHQLKFRLREETERFTIDLCELTRHKHIQHTPKLQLFRTSRLIKDK